MSINSYLKLWGKLDEEQGTWHALLFHLIDAGMVAKALWKDHLSESFKTHMREIFGLNGDEVMNLICFWVSLHDIGKAGPLFQRKSKVRQTVLESEGIHFPPLLTQAEGHHGLATTWVMREYFQTRFPGQNRSTNRIANAIGGHHGEFPLNHDIIQSVYQKDHLGDKPWQDLREELIDQLENIFSPPQEVIFPEDRCRLNAACFLIAGLTTTADWIASIEACFPYQTDRIEIPAYIQETQARIPKALRALNWHGWTPDGKKLEFEQLFPDFQPNQMQTAFIREMETIKSPFLVILEAPTGSGKTEAALFLADSIIQSGGKGGFYIAMPSQATSNQMFKRTVEFLERRYPQQFLNVQLVHGAALLNEFFQNTPIKAINQDDANTYAQTSSEDWFQPRKRTLLAPFGVGTVDQTFMAAMRCRHFFMRLFGLSHKVVIFDEVHAYDVYMLEIFKRLLSWLRNVNTSVIILSATLPRISKLELVEAYHGGPVDLNPEKFPRVTISCAGFAKTVNLGEPKNKDIRIDWIDDHEIEDYLMDKLHRGGSAAVIGNRVKRTQQLYDRIKLQFEDNTVSLFHSRFPACWRVDIEKSVIERYGKNSAQRPERSILVATQVVEQSLDLDFDVMVSDIAPVDLLIQRIGRLHRHAEMEQPPRRPGRLAQPVIALVKPRLDARGLPICGDDQYVYHQYFLLRTYFALRNLKGLSLPEATDRLIEEVYSDTYHENIPQEFWSEIYQHYEKLTEKNTKEELKAINQLIGSCHQDLLGSLSASFADEHDPLSLNIIQVLTRSARPTVDLVCLVKEGDTTRTLHENHRIDLENKPDPAAVRACLFSTARVAQSAIVAHFLSHKPPAAWMKNAWLRTRYPVIFEEGVCPLPNHSLTIDRERGLQVWEKA